MAPPKGVNVLKFRCYYIALETAISTRSVVMFIMLFPVATWLDSTVAGSNHNVARLSLNRLSTVNISTTVSSDSDLVSNTGHSHSESDTSRFGQPPKMLLQFLFPKGTESLLFLVCYLA